MNYISCQIEGGNIFSVTGLGQRDCIGVTVDAFNAIKTEKDEALKTLEEAITIGQEHKEEKEKYYNMLIEHGIITKPKSQEEINQELVETNKLLMEQLMSMKTDLEEMKKQWT